MQVLTLIASKETNYLTSLFFLILLFYSTLPLTAQDLGAYAARGVHGQTIYIDPAADVVIVRFASHPVAANSANDATSLPAYQSIADYLMNKK